MNKVKEVVGEVMELFSAYNRKPRKGIVFEGKSLTQQHFKNEVDINQIIERAEKSGFISVSDKSPMYGDFTGLANFREARQMVVDAQEAFEALPAKIRQRFNNDPQELVDFVDNPENEEEAIELGLRQPAGSAEVVPEVVEPEKKPQKAPEGPKKEDKKE